MSIPVGSPLELDAAVAAFHAEHDREHNYRRDDAPVEIYRLNVRAVGVTPKPELRRYRTERRRARPTGDAQRPVRRARRPVATPVYTRERAPGGRVLDGPAMIDQLDSTTLVPPGVTAEVDEWLNVRIHVEEAR